MLNQINHQSVFNQTEQVQPKKLHLKKGQIFQGQVIRLFPNNLAALQIGQMNVSARLEAALTAGQTYWFEVTQSSGIPRLRVLDDNLVRDSQQTQQINGVRQLTPQQLLQQMGITANKTNETLLNTLIREKIPFTKEMITQGGALLNELGLLNDKGVQTLASLVQRGLPLTKDMFMAIHTLNQANTTMIHDVNNVISLLQQVNQPNVKSYVNDLQAILNGVRITGGTEQLFQLFANMANQQSESIQQGSLSLLKQLGIVPSNTTETMFYEQFKNALLDPRNAETVRSIWPFVQSNGVGGIPLHRIDSKMIYQLFMSKLEIPPGQEGESRLNQFLSLFKPNISSAEMKQQFLHLMNSSDDKLTMFEKNVLEQIIRSSVSNEPVATEQKSSLASQLMKILTSLGMSQEKELAQFLQGQRSQEGIMQNAQLKSLLLKLNKENVPTQVKKLAQTLIYRLTGQQLIANESVGPLQQIITQIPIQLGHFPTELTIQWEGKKKSDGKIDSDHCRILFYLQLERLNETVVDVQIQKRLVSIQVFNEHDRPQFLVDTLYPLLKEQLAKLNYQLSSFNWRKIEEATTVSNRKQSARIHSYEEQRMYEGIDYRV